MKTRWRFSLPMPREKNPLCHPLLPRNYFKHLHFILIVDICLQQFLHRVFQLISSMLVCITCLSQKLAYQVVSFILGMHREFQFDLQYASLFCLSYPHNQHISLLLELSLIKQVSNAQGVLINLQYTSLLYLFISRTSILGYFLHILINQYAQGVLI